MIDVYVRADIEHETFKLCEWPLDALGNLLNILGSAGINYQDSTYYKDELIGRIVLDDTGIYYEVVIDTDE